MSDEHKHQLAELAIVAKRIEREQEYLRKYLIRLRLEGVSLRTLGAATGMSHERVRVLTGPRPPRARQNT